MKASLQDMLLNNPDHGATTDEKVFDFETAEIIEYSEKKETITSIVAILNKHGSGELYFVVRNNGDVLGQVINDETLCKVSQAIKNHITPSIFPEITIKTFEGGKQTVYVKFSGDQQPYLAHNVACIR